MCVFICVHVSTHTIFQGEYPRFAKFLIYEESPENFWDLQPGRPGRLSMICTEKKRENRWEVNCVFPMFSWKIDEPI